MSRAQKFLIGAGVLWLAASTQVGLLFLRDSIGELPVLLSSVAMIVLTPLVLIAFAWLWIRPQPPAPKVWITTLTLPWIVAGLGLILGRTVNADVPQYSPLAPTPVRYYWARLPSGSMTPSPDFYGDSVFIERLTIRFRRKDDPTNRYDSDKIVISGILRNASRSTVVLEDYWGEYLSNEARAVGDFRCQMSNTWKCGFAQAELRPGYVTDFSNEVSLGPSLARRDTLTLHIRFRVHDRF